MGRKANKASRKLEPNRFELFLVPEQPRDALQHSPAFDRFTEIGFWLLIDHFVKIQNEVGNHRPGCQFRRDNPAVRSFFSNRDQSGR